MLITGCAQAPQDNQGSAAHDAVDPATPPQGGPVAVLHNLRGQKTIDLSSLTDALGAPDEKIEQAMNAKMLQDQQTMKLEFDGGYPDDAYYCFTSADITASMVDVEAWRYYLTDDQTTWVDVLVTTPQPRVVGWEQH